MNLFSLVVGTVFCSIKIPPTRCCPQKHSLFSPPLSLRSSFSPPPPPSPPPSPQAAAAARRRRSGGQSCDAARWRRRRRCLGGPESCDARRAQPRWMCDGRRACGNGDTRWVQPRRTSYGNNDDLGPWVLSQEGLGRGRGIYGRRRAVCGESNRGRGACGGSGCGDPALPPLPLSDPVVTLPSPPLQAMSAPSSLEAATTMATGGRSGGAMVGDWRRPPSPFIPLLPLPDLAVGRRWWQQPPWSPAMMFAC